MLKLTVDNGIFFLTIIDFYVRHTYYQKSKYSYLTQNYTMVRTL